MAFSSFNTQFQRLGPVNDAAPTIWVYKATEATLSTIAASGYFNAVSNKLKAGDLIYVVTGASPWLAGLIVVKSNTRNLLAVPPVAGVVDCFNATTINTTINSG